MLGSFKLNFILLYTICGFTTAYVSVYLLKKHFLGRLWGAILIGVVGSFLGAFLSSIFLQSSMNALNIFSAFLISAGCLYVFGFAGRDHHE